MAGTGGKRPGSGRPKGVKNIATNKRADIARIAINEEITPLEVMLKAMRKALAANDLKEAHNYAKDAAPYIHPKLAATTHTGPNEGPIEVEHSFSLNVFEGGQNLEPKE